MKSPQFLTQLFCLFLATHIATGGENAAPSSHMVFDDNFDGDILINQVRVPKDGEALYTYYETLGWSGKAAGYAGIQAHPKARNYIFSIWDHKEHAAPIKAVYHGAGTKTEKFGGEGTGLKSWNFDLGWETDVWYTLVLRGWPVGDHTYFGYWVRSGKTGEWTHLVTMDVAVKDANFRGGTDAFIEDWLETGVNSRTTHLRRGWRRKLDGSWFPFSSGRYSVNKWDLDPGKRSYNFRTNWDGGVAEDETGPYYYMIAGGKETKPTAENPSRHTIERTEKAPDFEPIKISSGKVEALAGGKLGVSWEIEKKALPQFSYEVKVLTPLPEKSPITIKEEIIPHARSAELQLPLAHHPDSVIVEVRCRDIFGNESAPLVLRNRND